MIPDSNIVIKLDVYREANTLYFKELFSTLLNMLRSNSELRIGIAPANMIAEDMLNRIRQEGYNDENIFVYDRLKDKVFPAHIYDYNEAVKHNLDKLLIVSPVHGNTIYKRIISLGIDKVCKTDVFDSCMTAEEALERIISCEDKSNVNELNKLLGEKDVVVVNCPTLFYDVNEKIKIYQNDLHMDVVWIDFSLQVVYDKASGIVHASLPDVINYIRQRKRKDNILYFSVNPVWHLVLLYVIRIAFPDIRIILYKYDWLNLFCPYAHREILQKFLNIPSGYLESEYRVFDLIINGNITDGLLYKDGGDDFDTLSKYNLPKLFFPAYLPKKIYQTPPADVINPNKMIYLGKLFSESDYPAELFSDAFLFDVLNDISKQGLYVDLYYVDSPAESVNAYKNYFKDNSYVNIFEGKPLDRLFPEISGKYHWGYLVNNYRDAYSVIKRHVESALPARIFAFLALGVPVVVSDELTFTADFVRSNNIGVSIATEDICNISSILNSVDYKMLAANVQRVREELSLERQKDKFIRFIREVMKQ